MQHLDSLLARLGTHPLPNIALGLERIRQALFLLGHPENHLPPVVHVAGTNGKGSTIAFLQGILQAAGYRVHVYTSPHLMRFNERIQLSGEMIDDVLLAALLEEVIEKTRNVPLTFFESTTAAAFLAFAQRPADILLLETGLGGRLDATNVIDHPALTILTPISFDHMEYLGNTLQAIATEKAGILKSGAPCVVAPQDEEALAVIEQKAQEKNVPLSVYGIEWKQRSGSEGFDYHSSVWQLDQLRVSLPGTHQYINAATAIAAAEQLRNFTVTPHHIAHGLLSAVWPGRLQRIYPPTLPEKVEVYLDGGHNVAGLQAQAVWIKSQPNPVHVVLGMLRDKEIIASAALLSEAAASLTITTIHDEARAMDGRDYSEQLQQQGIATAFEPNWQAAVNAICDNNSAPFSILITGSLYLAGEVLLALSGN
ncbi:MAG: folylpolyglutamate synthase/dihydrofolate synthase family protein [Rickettsiales bacterium]